MSANTERYERQENAVARRFEAWNAREPEALAKAVTAAWAAGGVSSGTAPAPVAGPTS